MRIEVLNCPIDAISMNETVQIIDNAIINKKQIHHVVVNVAKLVHLQKDAELKNSVVSCDIINADGQGVVWAGKFLGKNIPERVTGIDLMMNLISLAHNKNYRIFFLGAKNDVIETVIKTISNNFSSKIIAGYRNGYFTQEEELQIAEEIATTNPDILFVAMSSPKKENFLFRNKLYLNKISLIMGVGGSFDVLAGKVKRAPNWMQKSGLEWLFRLIQEPRRMFYRYFSTNLHLIILLLKEKIFHKNET